MNKSDRKYKGAILIDGNNNILQDNRQKSKLDRCENKDYNKGYDEGRKDYADEVKRILKEFHNGIHPVCNFCRLEKRLKLK